MTLSLSVTESGSGEKREGAFSVCSVVSVQPATDLLLHKSRSLEQGRAQIGGRLQVTLQPLTQPSLAGCFLLPLSHPAFVSPSPSLHLLRA